MLRLLLLRVVPLVLRPMVILLEGALVEGGNILVLTLPIAMMALTISSIPVHIDYFRADQNNPARRAMGEQYVSGLLWVMLLSLAVLAPALFLADLGIDGWLITATCSFFLIEKQADEISRMLEFNKAFRKWFLVQTARSGWMLVPIMASLVGFSYERAFVTSAALTTVAFAVLFLMVTRLRIVFDRRGLASIRQNLIYLAGSVLPASYRQVPRILVARLFPEQAHIFLATAQLTQAVGILFNVRFQIPYRKLIARKTRVFQQLAQPAMLRLLLIPALIAPVWMGGAMLLSVNAWTGVALGVALFPLLVADSLMFAILAAHLGYLPWFERRSRVFVTYAINAVLLLALMMVYELPQIADLLSISTIVAGFIVLGLGWLGVILVRHFRSSPKV